jgi:hypothetical protein
MKTIIIRRVKTSVHGTAGVMIFEGECFALTMEREWLDNQTGISCIPADTYTCKRADSPRFGNTFEVMDVPNRTHILFHKGNVDDDSHGCIIVGEEFGKLRGAPAVLSSKRGYNEFMNIMKDDDGFRLIVVDDWKNPIN